MLRQAPFYPNLVPFFIQPVHFLCSKKKKIEIAGDLIEGVVGIEQTASHDAPVLTPMPPLPQRPIKIVFHTQISGRLKSHT